MGPLFALLDGGVAKSGYLAAGTFTLADMYLMPMLYYLGKVPESTAMLEKCKNLKAYLDRHLARASVRQTIPPPLPQHPALLAQAARRP
jgi:glutathione S-transferase